MPSIVDEIIVIGFGVVMTLYLTVSAALNAARGDSLTVVIGLFLAWISASASILMIMVFANGGRFPW